MVKRPKGGTGRHPCIGLGQPPMERSTCTVTAKALATLERFWGRPSVCFVLQGAVTAGEARSRLFFGGSGQALTDRPRRGVDVQPSTLPPLQSCSAYVNLEDLGMSFPCSHVRPRDLC